MGTHILYYFIFIYLYIVFYFICFLFYFVFNVFDLYSGLRRQGKHDTLLPFWFFKGTNKETISDGNWSYFI